MNAHLRVRHAERGRAVERDYPTLRGGNGMSLTVKCSCGINVPAPPESAEKRVNCPNCGSVIFFAVVGAKGEEEIETYGFASDSEESAGDPLDVAPDGPDASSAPCWLDRY